MKRVLLSLLLTASVQNSGAASIERFQSYVRTTQAAQGEFTQKVYDKSGKLVQDAHGSFAFLRPGRFRWTYVKPQQVIVGDGERVWIHDADLNQVTVRRVSRVLGATPAALLAGASDIANAFDLKELGNKDGLEWLEARPREKEAGFDSVRLGLSTGGVEAMELVDHFGQTTVLRFTDVVRNPQIDPRTFRFTPPKGADVLGD
ncbi:MAG TPA: outer membrane lipoprotein chaperone LolA [Burkholderiales bacterium]|nr:outer membrane lipoprotein chaperone LolA [Burkholderiales bacterium]